MNKPQVVFFGTGNVAASSLILIAQDFIIEAVITKPKPDHHHGTWHVLETANELGLNVLEVANKKAVTDVMATTSFESKVGILIDFGIIVEQKVIDSFEKGIINSHFSLLPQWRGADPITFSILSGQQKTGVSLMLLVQAMDEGPLLAVGEAGVDLASITTPELTHNLVGLSHALLKDTVPKYLMGEILSATQDKVAATVGYSSEPTYSRKLTKEDGVLDFTKSASQLEREIRAFAGWPKSRTIIGEHAIIITKASAVEGEGKPGSLWRAGKALGIYCEKGVLLIGRLKPAGKAEMTTESFLNGYQID